MYKFRSWIRNRLKPSFHYVSVYDIDFPLLKKQGITALFFDLDNTLVGRYVNEPTLKMKALFNRLHGMGFHVVIISNNTKKDRVKHIAEQLHVQFVHGARKPLPGVFRRVMSQYLLNISEVVMIGDQLLSDIGGGNNVGLMTIYVDQIGPEHALHRLLFINAEKFLVKWFRLLESDVS